MEEFRGLSTQKDESLGTSFALNKESSNNDLLRYFKAILKLQKLNESFPVNIDEVWMLVYTNRNKAIYSLRGNFIEGEDFNLYQMGKVVNSKELKNGIKIDAKLSVSCMEYFVARKSRPVFDVYRKVFHKTAEILQEPSLITSKQINAKISWIRGCKSLLRLNENSTLLLLKQVGDPLGLPTPGYTSSNGILRSASELLKKNGRDITAQKFNEVAMQKGYLVELERPAAHGKVKRFKSITEKGKNFGENQVSPRNPKETQPSWYENKFVELLKMLDL